MGAWCAWRPCTFAAARSASLCCPSCSRARHCFSAWGARLCAEMGRSCPASYAHTSNLGPALTQARKTHAHTPSHFRAPAEKLGSLQRRGQSPFPLGGGGGVVVAGVAGGAGGAEAEEARASSLHPVRALRPLLHAHSSALHALTTRLAPPLSPTPPPQPNSVSLYSNQTMTQHPTHWVSF